MSRLALFFIMSVTLAAGQRPSFAGSRPIGYPELITSTTEGLGNRFGEDDVTTQRLPIEANGDRNLIDRLSKLPVDKQPFWFINWQAYEAHRQNPQTFPQKPNVFVDPMPANQQNPQANVNLIPPNSNQNVQNGQLNPAFNQQLPPTNINPQVNNRNNFETDTNIPSNNMNQLMYPNTAFSQDNFNQQPNRLPASANVYPQQNQFQNGQSFSSMNQQYIKPNHSLFHSSQAQTFNNQPSQLPSGTNHNNYSGNIPSTHAPVATQHR